MTISELLHSLRKAKPEARVCFDFAHCIPTTIDSWRGIYAEPALGWQPSGYSGEVEEYPTVASLIAEIEQSIGGRIYCGWKGGQYSYNENDTIHIDNPGDSTNTELVQVEDADWIVLLHTQAK